jgi:tRNA 2-thiouridine synthesizing protein A
MERATNEVHVDQVLDTSGLLCPVPVYKASLALQRMTEGQTLKLICTDPGALADIPALARQTGNSLVQVEDGGRVQTFWLTKGGGG